MQICHVRFSRVFARKFRFVAPGEPDGGRVDVVFQHDGHAVTPRKSRLHRHTVQSAFFIRMPKASFPHHTGQSQANGADISLREQAIQKRQHGRSQAVCSGLQRNGPDNLSVHIHQQALSLPVCDTHGRTIVFVPAQTVLRRSAAATGGAQAGAFHLAVPQHLLQQRAHRRDAYARCCSKLRAGSRAFFPQHSVQRGAVGLLQQARACMGVFHQRHLFRYSLL